MYEPSNCAMIKLDEIQDEKKLISKMNFMNYLTPYKLPVSIILTSWIILIAFSDRMATFACKNSDGF